MTRRNFTLSLAGSLFLAGAGRALAFDTRREKGRAIIEKAVNALGGDAFRNMHTRVETGRAYSFYRSELNGLSVGTISTKYLDVEPKAGSPELGVLERQVYGKKQEDAVLFTTTEAYEVTYRGAKPLADDRVKQYRENTLRDVLYILRQRLKEPGMDFDAGGADVVENQPVEAVDIIDSENRSVTVWFNSDTWLPAKQRYVRWDPIINDRREEITRFSKYRDAGDGVMWPHSIERERDTEKIFQLYAESVKIGQPLSDSLFELPRGIKILRK